MIDGTTKSGAVRQLRQRFWHRNRVPLRIVGAALLALTLAAVFVAARVVLDAYQKSRPRLITPLGRVTQIDVAVRKGHAFRITDPASSERLRTFLNSKIGRWSSRTSFSDALAPVDVERALEIELSIDSDGVHRVFDLSADELQSEGAVTAMNAAGWRELRLALDDAVDGDTCDKEISLKEVLASPCIPEMEGDGKRTWCEGACAGRTFWIADCPHPTMDIVLASMGPSYSRLYYDKRSGRLVGAKQVLAPGPRVTCSGTTPVTRGCLPRDESYCAAAR